MKFFSSKPDPKEAAMEARKETKKTVRSSQREIDRTIRDLDRQEKQLLMEIKKRAKLNPSQTDSVLKNLAKQLVQVRAQRDKSLQAKAQLGSIGMSANMMASQVVVASSVEAVGSTMKVANQAVDTKEMTKIMNEFMVENERMNIKEELLDDMLSDAFDTDEVEEEADQMTSQVLAELGLELDGKMVDLNTPSALPKVEEEEQVKDEDILNQLPDLQSRLDAL